MSHIFALRVYYEDTDFGGIVYHANYLKFIERARSEWVRSLCIDQRRMKAETGTVFAVRWMESDYLKPAVFDDELIVETRLDRLEGASLHLHQTVLRGGDALFDARVRLVCIGPAGRPVRLPASLRAALCHAPGEKPG